MLATNLTVRIDPELKANAETLFGELGMSLSTHLMSFCVKPYGRRGFRSP